MTDKKKANPENGKMMREASALAVELSKECSLQGPLLKLHTKVLGALIFQLDYVTARMCSDQAGNDEIARMTSISSTIMRQAGKMGLPDGKGPVKKDRPEFRKS